MSSLLMVLCSTVALAQAQRHGPQVKVMSYNIQNLFDSRDNPDTADEEFTPDGSQKWTEQVIADKILNLAEVIRSYNPDVIGISEVESQEMLERLVKEGLGQGGYVSVVTSPSGDGRGIRNGLISRYPVIQMQSHRVGDSSWRQEDGTIYRTRDILEVTLDLGSVSPGLRTTVFVNHWPSRRGGLARERFRVEAGELLTKLVVEAQSQQRQHSQVLTLGDFNDEIQDRSFREGLDLVSRLSDLADARLGQLFPLQLSPNHSIRGTYYFFPEKKWNAIDHIMLGKPLRASNLQFIPGSFRIPEHRFQTPKEGIPLGCELRDRKFVGEASRCHGGASDHHPLVANFVVQ